MITIIDIEWIEKKNGETWLTQISAMHVTSSWVSRGCFDALIRPPAIQTLCTGHMAFSGYPFSAFEAGEQEKDALIRLSDWLSDTDVLCFWHQQAADLLRVKWRSAFDKKLSLPCAIANERVFLKLHPRAILPGNPYAICDELGLEHPSPAHCSKNDVATLRLLYQHLKISQSTLRKKDVLTPHKSRQELRQKHKLWLKKVDCNYLYSKDSDVFHTRDCPVALNIHNLRGCIYYNSVGERRPCKLCNPQPDIATVFKAAIEAIPAPKPTPPPEDGPNFKEIVTERLLGGEVKNVKRGNLVGCCHNIIHPGKMTKRILEEHRCIQKECPFFERYEEYPFWVNYRNQKNAKRKSKLKKQQKKALADAEAQSMTTIRDALRECVPEEESQLDIIRVERIEDRHYRVFFVSDNRRPDGGEFPQFAKLAREQFPWWRLQMRHIKNIDGSFVTREEYHAKRR